VLGPLPSLHRWVVVGVAVAAFAGLGIWTALVVPALPTFGMAGAGMGALVGALAAFVLLHQAHQPRRVRVQARRRSGRF
jgi:hypothetical protein